MATIQSQLRLNDGMSGVLRSVTAALDTCLSSFERMQAASGQAMDIENITSARVALSDANATVEAIEQNYRQVEEQQRRVENQQNDVNRSIHAGSSAVDGLAGKVRGFVAAYASVQGIKQLFALSDSVASTQARLDLIVGTDNVAAAQQQIMDMANRTRASFQTTANAVTKLGINAGKSFSGFDEIVQFTELMNKNFIIGGASIQEQTAAMYQLTQAMAAGRLQGDEFRSIVENAPLLANAITEYMQTAGVSGTLKEWSADGLLTADVIKNALFATTDAVNAQFEKMPMTWGQVWNQIGNGAIKMLQPVLSLISAMARNWNVLGPIIMGVVTALGLWYGAQLVLNIVQGIGNTLKAVAAARTAMQTGLTMTQVAATTTATGAQIGLNAAMLACPWTWAIAGIGALISVIAGFSMNANKAGSAIDGVTESAKALEDELTQNIKTIEDTRAQTEAAGEKAVMLANEFYELATAANQTQSDIESMNGILEQLQEIMPDLNISDDILNNATAFSSMAESIRDVSAAFRDFTVSNAWAKAYNDKVSALMASTIDTEEQIETRLEELSAYTDTKTLFEALYESARGHAVPKGELGFSAQSYAWQFGLDDQAAYFSLGVSNNDPKWLDWLLQTGVSELQALQDENRAKIEEYLESGLEWGSKADSFFSDYERALGDFNNRFGADSVTSLQSSIAATAAESMGAAASAKYLADTYTRLYQSGDKSNGTLSRMGAIVDEINGIIPNLNAQFDATTGMINGIEGSLNSAADAFYRYAESQAFAAAYREEMQNVAHSYIQADLTRMNMLEGSESWNSDQFRQLYSSSEWQNLMHEHASSQNAMEYLSNGLMQQLEILSTYGNTYEQQTAENTASMADSLRVSAEDLKYMRDVAEREAINRFTTAEMRFDMSGWTNRVESEADIDGVVNRIVEGFKEAVSSDMEGAGAA